MKKITDKGSAKPRSKFPTPESPPTVSTLLEQNPQQQLPRLARMYDERFGHGIPRSVLQSGTPTEELNRQMRESLATGNPVPEWEAKKNEAFGCVIREAKVSRLEERRIDWLVGQDRQNLNAFVENLKSGVEFEEMDEELKSWWMNRY